MGKPKRELSVKNWIPPYQVRGRLNQVRNDKDSKGTFEALHQPLLRDRPSTKLPETPSNGKKSNEKEERR